MNYFETQIRPLIHEHRFPPFTIVVAEHAEQLKEFAEQFAKALLCEHGDRHSTTENCAICQRIDQHQSEYMMWIAPQTSQIKVEQTRAVLDFLSLQNMSRPRVIVIENSESLNAQASNQLLKILEEPPPQTFFMMLRRSTSLLMPTVRSRAVILRLPREEVRANVLAFTRQTDEILRGELLNDLRNELKDREFARDFVQSLLHELHRRATEKGEATEEFFFRLLEMERGLRVQRDPVLLFEEFSINLKRAH